MNEKMTESLSDMYKLGLRHGSELAIDYKNAGVFTDKEILEKLNQEKGEEK